MGAATLWLTRSRLYDWLRLKGYVAFDLPRAVTALGTALLLGIAAIHVYVLASRSALPALFVGYVIAVAACCVSAAVAMWLARNPRIPRLAWFGGDAISIAFIGGYLASRPEPLAGLATITGRWDFAPGTLAGALALAFVTVHGSVLLGINVAYPQRQQWTD